MSALAADHRVVNYNYNNGAPTHIPRLHGEISMNSTSSHLLTKVDLLVFDTNTLLDYIHCFVKNFVGASETNPLAIDDKIEQAMDLVKNHLMFAVREEVDSLKVKISELMERVTELETENSILKANASEGTLGQLQEELAAALKNSSMDEPKSLNNSCNPS